MANLRLLSLDGGGVRGLSSLLILKALMIKIKPDDPPKPCDCFDLIVGTSTGGLIAIMLGRLRMSVDECIYAYRDFSSKVFVDKRVVWEKLPVHRDGTLRPRYDADTLQEAIESVIMSQNLDKNAELRDLSKGACKVAVCTTRKETGGKVLLTSYPDTRGTDSYAHITIVKACLATSAATTYFKPTKAGALDETFVDGAFTGNNPVFEVCQHARHLWGAENGLDGQLQCLVSVGTGTPKSHGIDDRATKITKAMVRIATETKETEEKFRCDNPNIVNTGRYYRFNVPDGLAEVGMAQAEKYSKIASMSNDYVEKEEVNVAMKACAKALTTPYRKKSPHFHIGCHIDGAPPLGHFVPRPAEMDQLQEYLIIENPFLKSPPGKSLRYSCILYGPGGSGKTRLALDFARDNRGDFDSVLWLDASSEHTLKLGMAKHSSRMTTPCDSFADDSGSDVAGSIGSLTEHELTEPQLSRAVAKCSEWLKHQDNTRWLVILDNFDKLPSTTIGSYNPLTYLPEEHGTVLITSRRADVSHLKAIRVKPVGNEIALKILREWCDNDAIMGPVPDRLLYLLGGLPLALAQAGAYMRQMESSAKSYTELYEEEWDDLFSDAEALLDNYEMNSKTTWNISFRAIERESQAAADLLRLWGCIGNKNLWQGLFTSTEPKTGPKLPIGKCPPWLHQLSNKKAKFSSVIQRLLNYSLVDVAHNPSGVNHYSMHPVIHRWASSLSVHHVAESGAQSHYWIRLALELLARTISLSIQQNQQNVQQGIIPHADALRQRIAGVNDADVKEWCKEPSIQDSFHFLGLLYASQGRLVEAKKMYRIALDAYKRHRGERHKSTLRLAATLGALYLNRGNAREAEKLYRSALEGYEALIVQKGTSSNAPGTLCLVRSKYRIVIRLGCLHMRELRFSKAEELLVQGHEGCASELGSDDKLTWEVLGMLAELYRVQGKLDDARGKAMEARDGLQKLCGDHHPLIIDQLKILGQVYSDQLQFDDARETLTEALRRCKTMPGEDHRPTLEIEELLGRLELRVGQFARAEHHLVQALNGYARILGNSHPATLGAATALGMLYSKQLRTSEAATMLGRVLDEYARYSNQGGLDQLRAMSAMADVQLDTNDLDNALVTYQRVIQGYTRIFGSDHKLTLDIATNLATVHARRGNLAEARCAYDDALRHLDASRHHDKLRCRIKSCIAALCVEQGNLAQAETLYRECAEGYTGILGAESPSTLRMMERINDVSRAINAEASRGGE